MQKISQLLISVFIYCLALLSKENAITFLAIVPLTYYIFTNANTKQYITGTVAFLIPSLLFMVIRSHYAPSSVLQESTEILNNPFTLATTSQRYATIFMTWLSYIKLLFIPYPLTHDYYYNQIPYVDFTSIKAILSIIVHIGLAVYAIKLLRRKSILGYGILFYFITFSIVSNLFFSVGILMNERFLFVSSLGFCIALSFLLMQGVANKKLSGKTALALMIIVSALYAAKTIDRNFAWKSNLILLKTDVKSSPNSAKAHASLGGLLIEETDKVKDSALIKNMLAESIDNLNVAVKIYPTYTNAWILLGSAIYKYNKADSYKAIEAFQKAYEYSGFQNAEAISNIGVIQLENNMPTLAIENFKKANALQPKEPKYWLSLGEAYSKFNLPDSAIYYYKQGIQMKPEDGSFYYKIGVVYGKQMNRLDDALIWLGQAVEHDPGNIVYLEDLAVANGIKGNIDSSIKLAQQIIQLDPDYLAAYNILSTSYLKKGDKATSDMYLQKVQALQAIKK